MRIFLHIQINGNVGVFHGIKFNKGRFVRYFKRNYKLKCCPFPIYTGHIHKPAHLGNQLFGNGKSQSGSFFRTVLFGIKLLEAAKKLFHIFFGDANTGILYGYIQINSVIMLTLGDFNDDTALFGKFHCVCQQIYNHLSDAHLIPNQPFRDGRINTHDDFNILISLSCHRHVNHIINRRCDVKGFLY